MTLIGACVKKVVPVALFLASGYLEYAVCYVVAHQELSTYAPKSAIAVYVLMAYFHIYLLFYWAMTLWRGPGHVERIEPFDLYGENDANGSETTNLTPVPDVFPCDENGFPFWCSNCQQIKPPRTSHLSDMGRCVPKLDHYCLWIGTVVAKRNYLYFFKFIEGVIAFTGVAIAATGAATRKKFHTAVNGHYIAVFAVAGFGFSMAFILWAQHVVYVYYNITTIDDLGRRRRRKYARWKQLYDSAKEKGSSTKWLDMRRPVSEQGLRYVNMLFSGKRVVVTYSFEEKPYNVGPRQNFINLVRNSHGNTPPGKASLWLCIALFLLPVLDTIPSVDSTDQFSPGFLEKLYDIASQGKYTLPAYIKNDSTLLDNSNSVTK